MRLNRQTLNIIKSALQEDIGREDITTLFVIPHHAKTEAVILVKESGVLCGVDIARAVFKLRSEKIKFTALKQDGDGFIAGDQIIKLNGEARAILAAERVALNFMSLLSGISSLTNKFVKAVSNTSVKILDTRKTTPNLRALEKYAVRMGKGKNHRKALEDAILVKDNHLRAGKFVNGDQVDRARLAKSITYLKKIASTKIEIEVENLVEFESVIEHRPDIIMLDNFDLVNMKKAVQFRNQHYPRVKLEASGGVKLDSVRAIAQTGVDFISVGAITHSAPAIDFSLEIINSR